MAANIITEILGLLNTEVPLAEAVADKLQALADIIGTGGPDERDKAIENGAYTVACGAWGQCCYSGMSNVLSPSPGTGQCRDAVLRVLYTLTAGKPDIIDELGWRIITQAVDKSLSEETHILVLRVIRNISIKSEENREMFTWRLGLLEPLASFIIRDKPSNPLVQEWCSTMKALVLSDDPRVPYNRAPERKRLIFQTKVLPIVAGLLNQPEYEKDEGALNALIVFLGTMASTENNCIAIESGNVLSGIYSGMKTHYQNKTLFRNLISLLRYLCVDQTVREKCSSFPFMKHVMEALTLYKKEKDIIDVALSCCAMMTLKNACQTSQFLAKNGPAVLFQLMNEYKDDTTILKGACFTLRNVCENGGPEARNKMLEIGFGSFLSELLLEVIDLKEFYLMPVLRSLGQEGLEQDATGGDGIPLVSTAEESAITHPEENTRGPFGEAEEEHL